MDNDIKTDDIQKMIKQTTEDMISWFSLQLEDFSKVNNGWTRGDLIIFAMELISDNPEEYIDCKKAIFDALNME